MPAVTPFESNWVSVECGKVQQRDTDRLRLWADNSVLRSLTGHFNRWWNGWANEIGVLGYCGRKYACILFAWIAVPVDRWGLVRAPGTRFVLIRMFGTCNWDAPGLCDVHCVRYQVRILSRSNFPPYCGRCPYSLHGRENGLAQYSDKLRDWRPRNRGSIPGRGQRFISSHNLRRKAYRGLFPGVTAVGTWCWPRLWTCGPAPPFHHYLVVVNMQGIIRSS